MRLAQNGLAHALHQSRQLIFIGYGGKFYQPLNQLPADQSRPLFAIRGGACAVTNDGHQAIAQIAIAKSILTGKVILSVAAANDRRSVNAPAHGIRPKFLTSYPSAAAVLYRLRFATLLRRGLPVVRRLAVRHQKQPWPGIGYTSCFQTLFFCLDFAQRQANGLPGWRQSIGFKYGSREVHRITPVAIQLAFIIAAVFDHQQANALSGDDILLKFLFQQL